jgi:O-antigen ligase
LREVIVWSTEDAAGWPWGAWLPWLLVLAGSALLVGSIPRVYATLSGGARRAGATTNAGLKRLEAIPAAVRYLMLAGLAGLVAVLAGIPQVLAMVALFGLLVVFPALGPPLLAVVAPLFLVPVSVLGRPISPTEMVGWLAVAALAVHGVVRWLAAPGAGDPGAACAPVQANGLDWAVVALAGVAVLATAAAEHTGVALRELRTVFLGGVIAYGLVRLGPGELPGGRFSPWPTVWGIALGALVVSLWGIYQAASGVGVIAVDGVARVRGPFGSPNNLALYLSHALPILLGVTLLAKDRTKRLMAALLGVPMVMALGLTFSRGALILGLPAAVLFLGFAAGGRWRFVALGLVAAGLLAMLPLFRTERFGSLVDMQQGSGFFRLQLWRGAWAMGLEHPWLGVGPDNFLYAYRTRYVLPAAWQELNLSHPHNVALDFATRLGLPGLLVGIWLFVAALRRGWQAQRKADVDARALLLGLMASLVATLAHGSIDNSVFLVDLMVLFMLSVGIINRLSVEGEAEG